MLQNIPAPSADSRVLTKMAKVYVTLKIMPVSPESDLDIIADKATVFITEFGGTINSTKKIPLAFGLNSLEMMFIMDESKGSTEELEKRISEIDSVSSVDVTDVRRAVG